MARQSNNRSPKKVIYVFWEGESEKAYSMFLKEEFEECAVIKCHHEKGTFQVAKSYFIKLCYITFKFFIAFKI